MNTPPQPNPPSAPGPYPFPPRTHSYNYTSPPTAQFSPTFAPSPSPSPGASAFHKVGGAAPWAPTATSSTGTTTFPAPAPASASPTPTPALAPTPAPAPTESSLSVAPMETPVPLSAQEACARDLIGLIHQHLSELGLSEAMHALERDTQYFFDMSYFRTLFIEAQWTPLTQYLSGFLQTSRSSDHSLFFFEILKQKFLDALERDSQTEAKSILVSEIRPFFNLTDGTMDPSLHRVKVYNEFASLLTYGDFRKHPNIVWVTNGKQTRTQIYPQLEHFLRKKLISLSKRTVLPSIPASGRLQTLLDQSVEYQKTKLTAEKRGAEAIVQTYFVDHDFYSSKPAAFGNLAFSRLPQPASEALDPLPIRFPARDKVVADSRVLKGRKGASVPAPIAGGSNRKGKSASSTSAPTSLKADEKVLSSGAGRKTTKGKKRGRPAGSKNKGTDKKRKRTPATHTVQKSSSSRGRPARYNAPVHQVASLPVSSVGSGEFEADVIAFHPHRDDILMVGGRDGNIQIWDVIRKTLLSSLLIEEVSSILHLEWSLHGEYGVVISAGGAKISLLELDNESNKLSVYKTIITPDTVSCAQFGFIPKIAHSKIPAVVLAVGLADGTVHVYDARTTELLYIFSGHAGKLTTVCVCHLRTNPILVTTSVDGTMRAWTFPHSFPLDTNGNLELEKQKQLAITKLNAKKTIDGSTSSLPAATAPAPAPAPSPSPAPSSSPSSPPTAVVKSEGDTTGTSPTKSGATGKDVLDGVIPKAVPMPYPISVKKEASSFLLSSDCRAMLFSGHRLYSCGADTETCVEWNAKSGKVKVKFDGFQSNSSARLSTCGNVLLTVTDRTATLYQSSVGTVLYRVPFKSESFSMSRSGDVVAFIRGANVDVFASKSVLSFFSTANSIEGEVGTEKKDDKETVAEVGKNDVEMADVSGGAEEKGDGMDVD